MTSAEPIAHLKEKTQNQREANTEMYHYNNDIIIK